MKKLLAVILSIICAISCFAPCASAAGGAIVGELATTFFEGLFDIELEEDTSIGYGVIYDIDAFGGVSVVYKPSPTISFENPGTYTITNDTPLAIDYEFVRWEDSKGNPYYAGDKIYVDGTITLYAVWVEKDDNDVRVARIIKTTFEAFKRLIGKFFGIFQIIVEFEPQLAEPGVYDLTLTQIHYEDKALTTVEGDERILFYIDSKGIYEQTKMTRIDPTGKIADIYLCSGWDIVTQEPLDKVEYELPYTFAELLGPDREDVLMIPTGNAVADYVNTYDAATYYMVVTIEDSLYSSSMADTGLEYDERCNPVSCVFTFSK